VTGQVDKSAPVFLEPRPGMAPVAAPESDHGA